jgi:hypothetical protein
VNCEACHGAARDWDGPHRIRETWRKTSANDKKKLGMEDMSAPEAQAEQCFSCHVGQRSEQPFLNRIVTHEMYAAGHPPLPSIEVASFSKQLPKHWRYREEKLKGIDEWFANAKAAGRTNNIEDAQAWRQKYWPAGANDNDKSLTRLCLIGNVVALRKNVEWLREEHVKDNPWPQLENFDCYACHHDLRVSNESWRQKRVGIAGKPGRPAMRRWPMVLVELAVQFAKAQGKTPPDLMAAVRELDQLFGAVPFGNPTSLPPAARKVEEASNQLIATLTPLNCDASTSLWLTRELARMAAEADRWMDYEEARQVGWALTIFWDDAKSGHPAANEIGAHLQDLEKTLSLALPGRLKDLKAGRTQVGVSYEAMRSFDAAAFKATLTTIHNRLGDAATASR